MKISVAVILMLGLLLSCSTSKTSLIVGDNYDKEANITTLTILPYGNIKLSGQWIKTHYNEISRQHFFKNKDSIIIAITKAPQEKYSFYKEPMSDAQFAEDFFEWEKEYFEQQGYSAEKLQEGEGYIIWRISDEDVNTIFLFGAKAPYAYNFSVPTVKWSDEKRIAFLENLFENN